MIDAGREVEIFAAPDSMLPPALAAGLGVMGWHCVVAGTGSESSGGPVIAILENDKGQARAFYVSALGSRIVGVGSVRSLRFLIDVCERGGMALNLDAPLPRLLMSLNDALHSVLCGGRRPDATLARLHRLMDERTALASLTRREREVLDNLLDGRTADEIAGAAHRSLPTVRSQIQAALRKLGVTSQVAAIAIAHRAGGVATEHGRITDVNATIRIGRDVYRGQILVSTADRFADSGDSGSLLIAEQDGAAVGLVMSTNVPTGTATFANHIGDVERALGVRLA